MTKAKSKPTHSSRTSTLLIATLFLTSSTLSTLFIHQLPDDPLHLAAHYGAYLHFANVMSIFGVIGAWRKNPLSIHLFSTYLLLDTLLSCIPRLLLLTLLAQSSSLFCDAPSQPRSHIAGFSDYVARGDGWRFVSNEGMNAMNGMSGIHGIDGSTTPWSDKMCNRLVSLGYVTLVVSVVAGMGLQVLGALCVREYARALFGEEGDVEMGGEKRGTGRGMPPIWEEGEEAV